MQLVLWRKNINLVEHTKYKLFIGFLQMIEGCPPFCYMQDADVPKAYASNERPPFRTQKLYAHGLKE